MVSSLEIQYNHFNLNNTSLGLAGYSTNNFKIKSDEKTFSLENEYYSFNDIFQIEVVDKNLRIYDDIEVNGSKKIRKFDFKIPKKYSIISPNSGLYYLERFTGKCELWIESINIPFFFV